MTTVLAFSAVTAEGKVAESEAESVTVPTKAGEITVLPNHIPLVSVLSPGVVTYRKGNDEHHLAVSGGFLQVGPAKGDDPSTVTILADSAERADDIDTTRAEQARKRAAEAMEARTEREEVAEAAAELSKNLARLKAAELVKARRRSQG